MCKSQPREDIEYYARRWIKLWNPPVDWDLFDTIHADEFVDCSPAGRPSTKAGFAQGLEAFTRAFPDLRIKLEDIIIDETGSRAAVRWSAIGTNREKILGVGPTNKMTKITGIEIIEIQWGRITRRWGEWDISAHIKQE